MNILIIHAHHEEKSFCTALKNTAADVLKKLNHTVVVSDLYKMGFNPVSSRADFKAEANGNYLKYQQEQTNAFQNNLYADDIKAEMEKFLAADLVIFNFPLWWFSMPAIMKGWIDKVFAMGFAYGAGKGVYENGAFKGKKAMLCFTTGGPQQAYGQGGKNGEMETVLFHIQHGMFYFVGMDVLEPFIAYSPARLNDEERKTILDKYAARLATVFEENRKVY